MCVYDKSFINGYTKAKPTGTAVASNLSSHLKEGGFPVVTQLGGSRG